MHWCRQNLHTPTSTYTLNMLRAWQAKPPVGLGSLLSFTEQNSQGSRLEEGTQCVSTPSPAKVSVSGDGSSQQLARLELSVCWLQAAGCLVLPGIYNSTITEELFSLTDVRQDYIFHNSDTVSRCVIFKNKIKLQNSSKISSVDSSVDLLRNPCQSSALVNFDMWICTADQVSCEVCIFSYAFSPNFVYPLFSKNSLIMFVWLLYYCETHEPQLLLFSVSPLFSMNSRQNLKLCDWMSTAEMDLGSHLLDWN